MFLLVGIESKEKNIYNHCQPDLWRPSQRCIVQAQEHTRLYCSLTTRKEKAEQEKMKQLMEMKEMISKGLKSNYTLMRNDYFADIYIHARAMTRSRMS